MKKLFISQPMRGKSDAEILAERERITRFVEHNLVCDEVEVIDTFFAGHTLGPLECLGESLKLMEQADIVCFAEGWRNARGCLIEYMAAGAYKKRIVFDFDA